jgi:hypothetical protein
VKSTRSREKGQAKGERRRLREKLAREARSAERRLRGAVVPNFSGPVLGRANIVYELAERTRGTAHGGMGLVTRLVKAVGLAEEVDSSLQLLKLHRPYHESDHVLNLAFNALCGGQRLDDIELRRRDQVFLDGIGAESLPDPTTAGDFCRFQQSSRHLDEPKASISCDGTTASWPDGRLPTSGTRVSHVIKQPPKVALRV